MVSKFRIDRVGGNARIYLPSFCRDSIFDGTSDVEIEPCEDSRGKFIKIRPIWS